MDHRPVRGFIQILPRAKRETQNLNRDEARERIPKLYGPIQTKTVQRNLYEATRRHYDLRGLQNHIKEALLDAAQQPSDDKEDQIQEARRKIKEIRTLRRVEPDEIRRKEQMKHIWKLIRQITISNATKKINTLKLRPKQEIHLPTSLRIQNEDSTDRELWMIEAKKFGESRFGDSEGKNG